MLTGIHRVKSQALAHNNHVFQFVDLIELNRFAAVQNTNKNMQYIYIRPIELSQEFILLDQVIPPHFYNLSEAATFPYLYQL